MADFNISIITNAGAALLAKSTAGIAHLKFTKLVTGSGSYTEPEKEKGTLQARTSLKAQEQEFPFSSVSMASDKCVKLTALISNKTLETGYYVNEIGVYAVDEADENAEPILYSIAVANIADYLPPYNGLTLSTITQEYFATVDNSLDITIQTNTGAVALAEDLEKLREEVAELLDAKQSAEEGKGLSTEDYTTAEKQKLSGIEEGANKTVVDAELSADSENPLQNKAIKAALDAKGPNFHVGMSTPFNLSDVWIKTDFAVQGWDY